MIPPIGRFILAWSLGLFALALAAIGVRSWGSAELGYQLADLLFRLLTLTMVVSLWVWFRMVRSGRGRWGRTLAFVAVIGAVVLAADANIPAVHQIVPGPVRGLVLGIQAVCFTVLVVRWMPTAQRQGARGDS